MFHHGQNNKSSSTLGQNTKSSTFGQNNTKCDFRPYFQDVTNSTWHVGEDMSKNPLSENSAVMPTRRRQPAKFNGPVLVSPNTIMPCQNGQIDNIDERDRDDPLYATEYVQEMYQYFREREIHTSVRPFYMGYQNHINEHMRSILVDWLVTAHFEFKLEPETLYLTINIIDRYLEKKEVLRSKLQLVGVTSLLIASKYNGLYPLEICYFVCVCDGAYSKQEILDMEKVIMKTLEYQITIPSAFTFLLRFLKAAGAGKNITNIACYILDGTLQSYNLMHYLPSQLAAAVVFIARRVVGKHSWSSTLLRYTAYREEEVIPIARAILEAKSSESPDLQAVNIKYRSKRYGTVANTVLMCNF